MPAGLFGITDETVNLIVNLLVLFLVVLWIALIAWTFFDARRRIEDPVLVAFATAAALFPYVGSMIYAILRPPEFLEEKHERELEIRAAELRVRQLEEQACPNCEHPLERTFLRCPACRARIKDPCPSCAEPVDPRWSVCPYCEHVLRRPPAPERKPATVERREKPAPRGQRRKPERGGQPQPAPRGSQAQSGRKSQPSPGDDGSRRSPADGQPRPQERKERPQKPSGRRTSGRQRG